MKNRSQKKRVKTTYGLGHVESDYQHAVDPECESESPFVKMLIVRLDNTNGLNPIAIAEKEVEYL